MTCCTGFQFEIEREDRLTGVIETRYNTGSGCLEPWRHDSVGHANRLESTLQSIRRRVRIRLAPGNGTYVVFVEAFKEKEDLPGLAANSPGGATFQENTPLERDLNPVVGQSRASGWIPLGRDLALEAGDSLKPAGGLRRLNGRFLPSLVQDQLARHGSHAVDIAGQRAQFRPPVGPGAGLASRRPRPHTDSLASARPVSSGAVAVRQASSVIPGKCGETGAIRIGAFCLAR